MNFNSFQFLIFLPVVLVLYWLLPHKFRWMLLLAASYYFYMCWNVELIWLILTTTLVSYGAALLIEKYPRFKKPLLILTLAVCLGMLVYFKYFDFLVGSVLEVVNRFSGSDYSFSLNVLLPVGISFYTFQTLSYVIDVYRGRFPAEQHFGYYALFVSYFPQLVAGPIESVENLLPQLRQEHHLNWQDFSAGVRILLCGFFRKCVVADLCGIYVNRAFADMENANCLTVLLAGALFCIQMYCDFAGYSEIATGAARMMGVRLMRNFDRPYLSVSYSEFFRRWHISLNQWFTSYVYIPLGGSRKGKLRRTFNTVVVFFLCGLWHGANWTYVLWGLYAAFFVSVEGVFLRPAEGFCRNHGIDLEQPAIKLLRRCVVFAIFIPAALLFRAQSVEQVGQIFLRLFSGWSLSKELFRQTFTQLGLDSMGFAQLVLSIVTMCMIYGFGEWGREKPVVLAQTRSFATEQAQRLTVYVYMTVIVALCWIALLATQANSAFAYFQF